MEIKLITTNVTTSGGGVGFSFIGNIEIPKEILMRGTTVAPNQIVKFTIDGVNTSVTSNDKCVFEITEGDKELTSCEKFSYLNNALATIDEFNYDTDKVTTMSNMFGSCSNLTTIPLLNTSNVTIMSYMFVNCSNLTTIPKLNTSNVTNMYSMFNNCSKLTSIPSLDTSKVTDMGQMFNKCRSLATIPELDTSKVTDMGSMFYGCSKLTSIPELNTSNVTNMSSMFRGCSNLTTLEGFNGLKTDLDLSSSTALTHESLMNVINYAANVTSSRKILTLGTTNLDKLTNEEKAIATNKGWTLK